MFSGMEEDQNVLAYFSLLEERYRMMLYDARGERLPRESYFNDSQIECIEQTDHMIDYYFYFLRRCMKRTTRMLSGRSACTRLPRKTGEGARSDRSGRVLF